MGNGKLVGCQLVVLWLGVLLSQPFFFSLIHSKPLPRKTPAQGNAESLPSPANGVKLLRQEQRVVLSNGIVSLTLTNPDGMIVDVRYKGSDNLVDSVRNKEDNRGYWHVTWNEPGGEDRLDKLLGTSFKVIVQNENQIEISFTSTWNVGVGNTRIPLNIDKRFVLLRDSPGFYTYAVLERLIGWPAYDIQEGRVVFKLHEKFKYMAMSDERQRFMPAYEDRAAPAGQVLDYPEAVLLTNPTNPAFKGEVDDKYFYSCDNKDNKVHGWVSNDTEPIGFWMITPSNEFRTGGPFKQDLTSHTGPIMISMFISMHYAGEDLALSFQPDEYWKKVFGPVFVYLNSDVKAKANPSLLWNDAKQRMLNETSCWPYNFPLSGDFLKSADRGTVSGQLLVHDWFVNKQPVGATSAWVGLAPPGPGGSWQLESKGYQFWTQTDRDGNFVIKNVIPGTYSLFAVVNGTVGDYKHAVDIIVKPGSNEKLTNVVFEPPRAGPTLWEIGVADRTAAEFSIPDPSPSYKIHQYAISGERFRQYGLWKRYNDLYPNQDLVYAIGQCDYRKDWFFAHVTRNNAGVYKSPTWQIVFDLKNVNKGANYTLQIALASANQGELQVRFNNQASPEPDFKTGMIGRDNAVARHGIHGLYHFFSIGIAGNQLVDGRNTIFLTQGRSAGPFREIMYDYIRFEAPKL